MVKDIFIYGEVGKQVTLDTVLKEITPKAESYVVHIHSPGGDVFEGYAIYNALKNTGKEIEMRIEGTCASIAMSILTAASPGKIFSNRQSQLMVHNPRFENISGEQKDLLNAAALLGQIKEKFIKEWQSRTGLDAEQISAMYDRTTWMTPEEAQELGFVDEVMDVLKAVAKADFQKYNNMQDKNKILAFVDDFAKKVKSIWEGPKAITDTLEDGTVITFQSEDDDVTGKPVVYEDGSQLPPGTYTLNGGRTLTVTEGGIVETITEAEAPEQEPENDMKLKEENETLKSRVAELESALQARNDATARLEAKASDLETKLHVQVKALSDELKKFKETTVGDTSLPKMPVNTPPASQTPIVDPMKQFFGQVIIDPRK